MDIDEMETKLKNANWKNTPQYMPLIKYGKIIKCYDGDTVTLCTIIDGNQVRFNIRMHGYDCAEIRSKNEDEKKVAKYAKNFITNLLLDKMVMVDENFGYDKYGRLLLKLKIGEIDVNKLMLDKWGVKYDGGHKDKVDWSKWCETGLIE